MDKGIRMAFKKNEFEKAKMEFRTEDISVPAMAEWFEGAPVWKVRGLSGNELGRCNEMADSRKNLTEILQDLLVKKKDETPTDYVPQEVAKRIEYLMVGSVDPVCDLDMATKLNEVFPIEFRILTGKIIELTGQGQVVGKQTPSGNGMTSKQV